MKANTNTPQLSYTVALTDFNENMLTLVNMNVTIKVMRKSMIFIEHGEYTVKMYYSGGQTSFVIINHEGNKNNFMSDTVNSHYVINALNEYNNGNTKVWFDMIRSFNEYKR